MKPIFLSLFSIIVTINVSVAQGIHFQHDSIPALIAKAKLTGTPIMILLDAPNTVKTSKVDVRPVLLENANVVKKFEDLFICYHAAFASEDSKKLSKQFKVSSYPAFIFLNNYGVMIYSSFGFFADPTKYIQMADHVASIINSGNNIAVYNNRYNAGERSKLFLWTYITEREKLGFFDNSDLINEYVDQLTLKEINTYQQMLFILKAGPIIGSRATQLTFMFIQLRDSIYKTQPKKTAMSFNYLVRKNSFDKAVANKDRNFAYQVSAFLNSLYKNDYKNGGQAYQANMIDFYKAINDTTGFLQQSSSFYDTYYMNISIDSARRYQQKMNDSLKITRETLSIKYKDSTSSKMVYSLMPLTNMYASVLNNAAWDIYKTGTHNESYLIKAVVWCRRSIAIDPSPYNYDTLAHLLYQLGFYSEAETQQLNAISLIKNKKSSKEHLLVLNKALKNIRQRCLKE